MAQSVLGKINYLSDAQYRKAKEEGKINSDEIYMTPDGDDVKDYMNLEIGSVTTLPAGSQATAEITGTVTNPVLNLGIPQGDKGATGDKGDTGATGATGANGVSPNLKIGTVTTLAAGSNATATITGTQAQPILNLGIPQGAKGATGDKGATGAAAPTPVITKLTLSNISVTTAASGTVLTHTITAAGTYLLMGYSNLNRYNQNGRELHVKLQKNGTDFWDYLDVGDYGWTVAVTVSAVQTFAKNDVLKVVITNPGGKQWAHGVSYIWLVKISN